MKKTMNNVELKTVAGGIKVDEHATMKGYGYYEQEAVMAVALDEKRSSTVRDLKLIKAGLKK